MRLLLLAKTDPAEQWLRPALEASGFVVEHTESGDEGLQLAQLYGFDVVVIDGDLADMPGIRAVSRLRETGVETPVMMLSDAAGLEEKLDALNRGADDFMAKPFNCRELTARIRVIIRRAHGYTANVLHIGDLAIDLDKRTVEVGGFPLRLSETEYRILEVLALRRNRIVSKETILDFVYGGRNEPSYKTIDVFVYKIRQKLRRATKGKAVIETAWGRGFVLPDPAVRPPKGAVAKAA